MFLNQPNAFFRLIRFKLESWLTLRLSFVVAPDGGAQRHNPGCSSPHCALARFMRATRH
jgi:hypothetical protein